MFYVLIIGPHDTIFRGPYPTEAAASRAADEVPSTVDAYVMTDVDMRANIDEFGPCPIEAP